MVWEFKCEKTTKIRLVETAVSLLSCWYVAAAHPPSVHTYNIHMNPPTPHFNPVQGICPCLTDNTSLWLLISEKSLQVVNNKWAGHPLFIVPTQQYLTLVDMCSRKVAICVYLGTNQVNRRRFPPPRTFLCNTWTQWTSSKFIGPCDHPHHFHRLSFLPARVPSPTWFLCGFASFFFLSILFTLPPLVLTCLGIQ